MSTEEENNISIADPDEALQRVDFAGLRLMKTGGDDVLRTSLRRLPTTGASSTSKTIEFKGKGRTEPSLTGLSQMLELKLATTSPSGESDTNMRGLPENSKREDDNDSSSSPLLKRKRDDEYDEAIRQSYGYEDDTISDRHRRESSEAMTRNPLRFRPMRRNSFLIHRKPGRGGFFPSIGIDGISDAIAAVTKSAKEELPRDDDFYTSAESPTQGPRKMMRLFESTNAPMSDESESETFEEDLSKSLE